MKGLGLCHTQPFNNFSANHDISSAYKCSLVADIANKMNQNQTAPLGV